MHELNRKSVEEFKLAKKNPFVIVLDNVRSQNNIGSIFRTADAFLAEAVILCGITSIPPNKEIHKTALGATESVRWEYLENTMDAVTRLKKEGYIIICLKQAENSFSLAVFHPEPGKKYALVFGNEVHGVSQEIVDACDLCVEIPQYGTKHSLNIAVSAGIAVWEFNKQLATGTMR